jgi:hypothetical protein
MKPEWKYVTEKDKAKISDFLRHWMPRFAPLAPPALYHYTTGEKLIQIMDSCQLWSTHIACLNDTAEVRYALEELHKRVRKRRSELQNPALEPLLRRLDGFLSAAQLETAGVFVACFSEQNDDLSQWRAYSAGEGGYAIRFDSVQLAKSGQPNQILLLKVEYQPEHQAGFLDDIVNQSERYYLECDGKQRAPCSDQWAEEFVAFYLSLIEIFLFCLKHPAFFAEREWRLVYYYRPDDPTTMRFLQRSSMMARHLPLRLSQPLPINGVTIGPCRYPLLSKIAVSDLLHTHGYTSAIANVQLSGIPYRAV